MRRWQAKQKCLHVEHVGVGQVGIALIRHRWIKSHTVATNSLVQGVQKLRVVVRTNSRYLVGSDIGGVERSEWRYEGPPADKGNPARRGVTGEAVCDQDKIFAAFDSVGLPELSRYAGRIRALILRKRDTMSPRKVKCVGPRYEPQQWRAKNQSDDCDRKPQPSSHDRSHRDTRPAAVCAADAWV